MKTLVGLFISILVVGSLFVLFGHLPARSGGPTSAVSFPALASVVQALDAAVSQSPILAPTSPVAVGDNPPARRMVAIADGIRVPAIRESNNYGWLQLPRGAQVEVVGAQRDHYWIRYDESFVLIPRAAVTDGTVVPRKAS